ncbi:coiled-coil domain-containing protein 9B isoform X2 [Perognathus longimembris pacificus]|uniref:coiled-coil domain-containing protein 9B isoform X2 n=1 Tax=Perognathus longimembris pacificus TaxID=214514 RepID=UPI0020199723|nr:coiled-coil domain-containing protein 9B isoform X2 [Perognathus longimembris pacificus]
MHSAGPHRAEPPMHRQKDAELDQRIVALRKKNQALLRRYQEIQEDRRQAEQEGMAAPTAALLPPDSLTVTISQERRVVRSWARSPPGRGVDGEDEDAEGRLGGPFCMGDRVDLAVTMENKAEAKRVVSAKPPRARHQGPEGSPPSAPAQAAVSSDAAGKAPRRPAGPPPPQEAGWDYARWKREREQIDRARLARHRDAQGDWRRPWDLDKAKPTLQSCSTTRRGGTSRGRQEGSQDPREAPAPLSTPGGRGGQPGEPSAAPATGSRARGKERLTGRARRWDVEALEDEPRGGQGTLTTQEERVQKQSKTGPGRPETPPASSPAPVSPEEPRGESGASAARPAPGSPQTPDLAPLDLSLGGASGPQPREGARVLSPKPSGQESRGAWPAGPQQQPPARSDPRAGLSAQTRPASQREPGVSEPREVRAGEARAPQSLAPRTRPPRGTGQRERGPGAKSETGAPGPPGMC